MNITVECLYSLLIDKSPLLPMGLLAPGSAHARPSAQPPTRFFSHPKSYFFCELKPHAKFWNPTITPSGRKVTRRREREREEKITPLIVDTLFP